MHGVSLLVPARPWRLHRGSLGCAVDRCALERGTHRVATPTGALRRVYGGSARALLRLSPGKRGCGRVFPIGHRVHTRPWRGQARGARPADAVRVQPLRQVFQRGHQRAMGTDVTDDVRAILEQQYDLTEPELVRGRTWQYKLLDGSAANVSALVEDPRVANA